MKRLHPLTERELLTTIINDPGGKWKNYLLLLSPLKGKNPLVSLKLDYLLPLLQSYHTAHLRELERFHLFCCETIVRQKGSQASKIQKKEIQWMFELTRRLGSY